MLVWRSPEPGGGPSADSRGFQGGDRRRVNLSSERRPGTPAAGSGPEDLLLSGVGPSRAIKADPGQRADKEALVNRDLLMLDMDLGRLVARERRHRTPTPTPHCGQATSTRITRPVSPHSRQNAGVTGRHARGEPAFLAEDDVGPDR